MRVQRYSNSQYDMIKIQKNQDTYHLFIAKPDCEAPTGGYALLIVLDGNALFEITAQSVRLMTKKPKGYPPAIVVGIGYPGNQLFDVKRRTYDFTPYADEKNLPNRPLGETWPNIGGATEFLNFLEKDILPLLIEKYEINDKEVAIFGHSLGGLFILFSYLQQSKAFTHFIASSSSVWWNNSALIKHAKNAQELLGKLLIIVGENELPHMVEGSKSFYEVVKQFDTTFMQLSEEDHISVIPGAISRAIKFLLQPN